MPASHLVASASAACALSRSPLAITPRTSAHCVRPSSSLRAVTSSLRAPCLPLCLALEASLHCDLVRAASQRACSRLLACGFSLPACRFGSPCWRHRSPCVRPLPPCVRLSSLRAASFLPASVLLPPCVRRLARPCLRLHACGLPAFGFLPPCVRLFRCAASLRAASLRAASSLPAWGFLPPCVRGLPACGRMSPCVGPLPPCVRPPCVRPSPSLSGHAGVSPSSHPTARRRPWTCTGLRGAPCKLVLFGCSQALEILPGKRRVALCSVPRDVWDVCASEVSVGSPARTGL
jgi:hypothetical protein